MLQACSIDILGRRLAFSVLMNLDNSFEVGIVERSPLVSYICVSTSYTAKGVNCFYLSTSQAVQSLSIG